MTFSRRLVTLWVLFFVQLVCGVFFFGDAFFDNFGYPAALIFRSSDKIEFVIAAGLLFSLGFTASELWRLLRRHRKLEDQLKVASGAFSELLDTHFSSWGLTASERDVALLTIKGLSLAEVAALRDTREGTIKAQCTAVYKKAGVSSRAQLVSLFIEELMGETLVSLGETD